jgi:hypothetical protein
MRCVVAVIMVWGAVIACIVSSSILAFNQRDGWGWLLLMALLLGNCTITEERRKVDDEKQETPDGAEHGR